MAIDAHVFATPIGGGSSRITLAELVALAQRPPWMADGACIEHPEVSFFPARGESSQPAKDVCSSCLVRDECLAYALANGDRHGIWGGLSERERRRLRRSRAA